MELKGLQILRNIDRSTKIPNNSNLKFEQIVLISIECLNPGKYQPRSVFNNQALMELAESIKEQGIVQPLIVRKINLDSYEIISGERRWRAAKIVGLTNIPVIVRDIDDAVVIAISLIENIQRENLNPIEEAIAYKRLLDEFELTHVEISKKVGKNRSTISNQLRLLELNQEVKTYLIDGVISIGHAKALLTLNIEFQSIIAKKILDNDLSVRQTERLVNFEKEKNKKNYDGKINSIDYMKKHDLWIKKIEEKMPNSSKVKIYLKENGSGKITFYVNSEDEVDWLIDHIR